MEISTLWAVIQKQKFLSSHIQTNQPILTINNNNNNNNVYLIKRPY